MGFRIVEGFVFSLVRDAVEYAGLGHLDVDECT